MPEYLFDTTVLVDNFRGKNVVVPFVQPILDGTTTVWFSVITEAELWAGIKSSYEQVRYEALLRMMKRIPVTKTVARVAGELYSKYRHQGLSLSDALIAATARVYKKTLLTRNTKHFEPLRHEISCEFYS